jgi:hypothetical protein
VSNLPEVQGIFPLFIIAAGRVGFMFFQSVSIAAAYIKEGKPAHGYLTLVVVVSVFEASPSRRLGDVACWSLGASLAPRPARVRRPPNRIRRR